MFALTLMVHLFYASLIAADVFDGKHFMLYHLVYCVLE